MNITQEWFAAIFQNQLRNFNQARTAAVQIYRAHELRNKGSLQCNELIKVKPNSKD